jgi:hypothetical protein
MFETPKKKPKPTTTPSRTARDKISVTIPYIQGLSEQLQRSYTRHSIATIHKPYNTMRNVLVQPKDKTPDARKCGVVYHISCASCDSSYVGEMARSLQKRLSEHKKTRGDPNTVTGVGKHCANTGHTINDKDTKILAREDQW